MYVIECKDTLDGNMHLGQGTDCLKTILPDFTSSLPLDFTPTLTSHTPDATQGKN